MKQLLSSFTLLLLSFTTLQAQSKLENSKWTGVFNVPSETTGTLQFGKDTVVLFIDDNPFETMKYSTTSDTLVLTKISGNSPCGDEQGIYKFEIKDSKFIITLLSDPCGARGMAFSEKGYLKL